MVETEKNINKVTVHQESFKENTIHQNISTSNISETTSVYKKNTNNSIIRANELVQLGKISNNISQITDINNVVHRQLSHVTSLLNIESRTLRTHIKSVNDSMATTRESTDKIALIFDLPSRSTLTTNMDQTINRAIGKKNLNMSKLESSESETVLHEMVQEHLNIRASASDKTSTNRTTENRTKITKDILGHIQKQNHLDISEKVIDTAQNIISQSLSTTTQIDKTHVITNLVNQEMSELENRNIKRVQMDYVKQPAQSAPKLDDKPPERPMETLDLAESKFESPVEDVMTYKLPETSVTKVPSVDVDAIFDQIYSKFEKRIAFEKRRRGL